MKNGDAQTLKRKRGRPPKRVEGQSTQARLLTSAAEAFSEHGYEGATLSDIAARAQVTTGAIYNHFAGKESLLLASSRAALEGLKRAQGPSERPSDDFANAARGFLVPEFSVMRRLLIELHLTAARSPHVASLLADWHQEQFDAWQEQIPKKDTKAAATVKAYFLVLMGLTHIDALSSLKVPTKQLEDVITDMLDHIFAQVLAP